MTNKSLHEANQEKSQQKNKAGILKTKKGSDQAESQKIGDGNQEGSTGWEEQLWMDQADNFAPENDTTWQAEEVPIFNEAKAQVGKIFGQIENGLHSLVNTDRATLSKGAWLEGQNSQEIKRWSSLIGGGLLALFGLRRSLGSLALMGIGGGLVYYALTGKWLLPTGTTSSTRATPHTGRSGALSLDSKRPMTVKNVIVKAPLHEVYAAWADFENFPNFMQHIRAVTKTGERSSHWIMDGPFHSRLEWDAETTRLEENKRIAWSSTQGDIKTSGQVTFNALPDEEVEVTIMLRYIPPAGIVGDLFAAFFSDPEGKLVEDLRNFKRYIEKSESVATAA